MLHNFFFLPIYKGMKKKVISLFMVWPLLLGFATNTQASDVVKLAPFNFVPLVYKVSHELNFTCFTYARDSLVVEAKLFLTNRTFSNYQLGQKKTVVTLGRSAALSFTVPPYHLTSGRNSFRLTYTFASTSRMIEFRLGSYGGETFTLPTTSGLREMFMGVKYSEGVFTYHYYMFEYAHLHSLIELPHDLFLPLSSFIVDYDNESEVFAERVQLVFINQQTMFSRLDMTNDGYPYLDLSLEYNNNQIQYRLANALYVDDETHMISPVKEVGFRLGGLIYLPKNHIGDLEYGEYEMRLIGFSSIKLNIIYRFKLLIAQAFLASNGVYDIEYRWQ